MLDPVGELAARIATPAGPRLELGTVQQPPVGGTVLVVTADQAWTCILPSSIPVPAVGAGVKVRVEGNIRTVQEIYGPAAAPAVPGGTHVGFIEATPPTGGPDRRLTPPRPPPDGYGIQLVTAGKPDKIAITAVMRTLAVTANALIKADRCWQQSVT